MEMEQRIIELLKANPGMTTRDLVLATSFPVRKVLSILVSRPREFKGVRYGKPGPVSWYLRLGCSEGALPPSIHRGGK